MASDPSIDQAPSARHGNSAKPYPCHAWPKPPGAEWAIDYGACRTSLDVLTGKDDPRCPNDCKHKAPGSVAIGFDKRFHWHGAQPAAKWVREMRNG